MADVKGDVAGQSVTLKKRRELTYFIVDNRGEKIIVHYEDIQYIGTIGQGDYEEFSRTEKQYEGDKAHFDTWLASTEGQAIKSAIETNLAKDVPGT